jgi:DNA polymerase III delta prime subunit
LALAESLLTTLVGVPAIKEKVREITICHLESSKTSAMRGLPHFPSRPVWVLCGNPGVGKTTIADVLSRVFVAVGLATGPIVKLRKDAIPSNSPGAFLDKLATRVKNGVLIIDEVQSFLRSTTVIQFIMAQTDKTLADRPCVLMMGYPSPRRPNIDDFLRKGDSGLRRRVTDILTVPNFTDDMVIKVLQNKLVLGGYTLGVSANRLRRYVQTIPRRFWPIHNGSLAEKINSATLSLQALTTYSENLATLQERLAISRPTVRAAFARVVSELTRDESATVSG